MKTERRAHPRFPIANGLMEPITLQFPKDGERPDREFPAILTNLSAGGMSLTTFSEPPHTREFEIMFQIGGFNRCSAVARILRIQGKGEVYTLGLSFIRISKKDRTCINKMAEDFNDCETRISLSLPEVCVSNCRCHCLCSKPQKGPYWPEKASRA